MGGLNFLDCKRCFYLDRVKGLQEPSMPGWSLNTTVDDLLKKEFDAYREKQETHPIFKEYNLNFMLVTLTLPLASTEV